MWMAQGFIRSSSPDQCLEDIGHKYFMDLLWRSFFPEVEEDERGNILQFKMHDLAKSIAASDSTTLYSKGEDIHEKTVVVGATATSTRAVAAFAGAVTVTIGAVAASAGAIASIFG
uniref:Disease resistance protein winged helix domain-containing protein n=1 Tax=Quercus lobata TaxID=97700 RepID=A0A7N2RA49_QUELO